MSIVIDYTKGFFEPSPAGETVGDITSSTLDLSAGNGDDFVEVNGAWMLPYKLDALPLEQVDRNVRARRNDFLADTDWTQVADAPVDQAAWATYRQALRDVTAQEGFPYSVAWPTKPE